MPVDPDDSIDLGTIHIVTKTILLELNRIFEGHKITRDHLLELMQMYAWLGLQAVEKLAEYDVSAAHQIMIDQEVLKMDPDFSFAEWFKSRPKDTP